MRPSPPRLPPRGQGLEGPPDMTHPNYYSDRRWCGACRDYVAYLLSPSDAWCTRCGRPVALFSDEDRSAFDQAVRGERRPFDGDGPAEREYA